MSHQSKYLICFGILFFEVSRLYDLYACNFTCLFSTSWFMIVIANFHLNANNIRAKQSHLMSCQREKCTPWFMLGMLKLQTHQAMFQGANSVSMDVYISTISLFSLSYYNSVIFLSAGNVFLVPSPSRRLVER